MPEWQSECEHRTLQYQFFNFAFFREFRGGFFSASPRKIAVSAVMACGRRGCSKRVLSQPGTMAGETPGIGYQLLVIREEAPHTACSSQLLKT
jgi:hypothetical protein